MNVTLVKFPMALSFAPPTQKLPFWNVPPLGLLSLAGCIRNEVDSVKVIDLSNGNGLNDKILMNTDILGVGPVTRDFPLALNLLKRAKQVNPKIKTVIGGWHVTFYPNEVDKDYIDHIVVGEGEGAFKKIVLGETRNRIIQEPLIKHLDDLPYPAYDLVDISKYHLCHLTHAYAFEFSRGCSYHCSYCGISKFYNHTYRMKSTDRVVKELQYFNPKFGIFVDDNFAVNINRTKQLCEAMIDGGVNQSFYAAQLRVDTVAKHPELIKKMRDAGFSIIFIGIESPLKKTLKELKKNITWEQIKQAKKILDDNDMFVIGQLIMGSMGETEKDIRKYCNAIRTLDLDLMQLALLTPMPGTEFFNETEQKNIRFVKDWKYYDCTCCVFLHPNIDFRRMPHLHIESYIRIWYDPISIVKRTLKLLKFYRNHFNLINDLLDFKRYFRNVYWELPKFFFWSSNKSINKNTKVFINELKNFQSGD